LRRLPVSVSRSGESSEDFRDEVTRRDSTGTRNNGSRGLHDHRGARPDVRDGSREGDRRLGMMPPRLHPGITQEVAPNESQRGPKPTTSEALIHEALSVTLRLWCRFEKGLYDSHSRGTPRITERRRDPGESRRVGLEARSWVMRLAPSPGAHDSDGILRRRRRPRVDKREHEHRLRGFRSVSSERMRMCFVGIDVGGGATCRGGGR
jgi:hypothetical protein